jgi:multiple sugar transport system substrate-binding protein
MLSACEGVEMTAIDPSQPLPVYVQLKTLLLEEIVSGKYAPGAQLPTEHELCASFGISRTPVHRALAELAEEGAILRHRWRGTFVNPHWLQRQRSQQGKAEVRVVVPEGSWEQLMRDVCPDDLALSVASVELDDLHQVLNPRRRGGPGTGPGQVELVPPDDQDLLARPHATHVVSRGR